MRQMIAVVMAVVGLVGFAMPSEKEFATARTVVADVMEPELAAMKDGKKKPGEVADFALSLMAESETAAAKYLLAGRAYALYVKGGDYAKAVKAMDELQNAIPDMPCDRILKDLTPASKGVTEKKTPELYARLAQLKGRVHSQSEITKLKAELAKAKASEKPDLHRKLGENYAVMNDWKNALEHFVKAGGKIAEVSKSELDGAPADAKIAGFWWDQSEDKGLAKSVASAYCAHAAELYRKGLDAGTISGLNKRVAEQRIEASTSQSSANVVTAVATKPVRVPKGLAHRWSFNGDCKDLIGEVDAKLSGSALLKDGKCIINRTGSINVSKAVPDYKSCFTIEIWVTENERSNGGRVFKLYSCNKKTGWYDMGWATGSANDGWFYVNYDKSSKKSDCCGFELAVETYVAMTVKYTAGKGYEIFGYKYDTKIKKLQQYRITRNDGEIKPLEYLEFGCSVWPAKLPASIASFNECRIWTRCLSKGEIERSAKAGPDKLVL